MHVCKTVHFSPMNKTQIASAKILSLVSEGKTLSEAFDAVLGAGAFEKLAGEVYDTLTTPTPEAPKYQPFMRPLAVHAYAVRAKPVKSPGKPKWTARLTGVSKFPRSNQTTQRGGSY